MSAVKTLKSMWTVPERKPSGQETAAPETANRRPRPIDATTYPKRSPELPPPGPSNIIVLSANPLPAPKNVESQ